MSGYVLLVFASDIRHQASGIRQCMHKYDNRLQQYTNYLIVSASKGCSADSSTDLTANEWGSGAVLHLLCKRAGRCCEETRLSPVELVGLLARRSRPSINRKDRYRSFRMNEPDQGKANETEHRYLGR